MLEALYISKEKTGLTQLIEGNGKLNEKDLDTCMKNVKMEELDLEYAVVSIIGPQSSGKSTLLNHLFGTTFQEMNAEKGSSQTTVGIWIARAKDIEPCTLVIDVEGSDGKERGEDGTLFEKQSALFALAVSDVVLVNMWCRDIGREQGGGRPLLKIVFENILKLKSRRKTKLLFVLRDKSKSPLNILAASLYESIEKIFDSVPKPEAHKNSSLSNFFNVEVVSLPSLEYQEELFIKEVKTLRMRFVHSTSRDGLAGDKTDKVPSSDLSFSIKTIWRSIRENKDLDLPKHKIMVDTVRCDQIVQKCYSDFVLYKEWQNLEMAVKSGPVVGFGAKLSSIINTCLSPYDAKVIYCDEHVRITKRETLLQQLLKCVHPTREAVLEHQYDKAVKAFQQAFANADQNDGNFLAWAKRCLEYSKSIFAQGCKEIEVEHVKLDASKVSERVERQICQLVDYATAKKNLANAVAARAAAAIVAAENKVLADKATADAKKAAEALAVGLAVLEAARDAKAASDAQIRFQLARNAENQAAAARAMVAEMKANRAADEEREKARLARKKKEECTIL